MTVRFRARGLAALLLVGALLPLAAPAPLASADVGPAPVRLPSFGDVAVDETRGRLYLSRGVAGDGVLVTDLAGGYLDELSLPGANRLAMAPDGTSLWVAQPSGLLTRVDLVTGVPLPGLRVPTGQCPGDVAVVGDRLVYGHSCATYGRGANGGSYGGVGVLGTDGTPYGSVTSGPFHTPVVAAGPAGRAFAADAGSSPTGLHLYDVSGVTPRAVASVPGHCSNLRDLVSRADGSQVVTACGTPYQHSVFTADLQPLEAYPSGAHPVAGAFSADGGTFVAGLHAPYEPDVHVYRTADRSLRRIADFGTSSEQLQPRGLAVSGDGSRVWAVSRVTTGSTWSYVLRVLDPAGPVTSSLTLAADPPSVYAGQGTALGGRLSAGGTSVSGASLRVTRTGTGTSTELPTVTTGGDGTYRFADRPPYAGTWTYAVSWPGDATRSGAATSTTVVAHEALTTVALTLGSPGTGQAAGLVELTSGDPALVATRTVTLVRSTAAGAVQLAPLTTDAGGRASFTDAPGPGTYTYTAALHDRAGAVESSTSRSITLPKEATTLTASPARDTVRIGESVAVGGRLTAAAGSGIGGASLGVARSGCGESWQAVVTTAADGTWSVTDTPPVGTCTYRASYGGTPTLAAATASAGLLVELRSTTLTVDVVRGTGSSKKYAYVTARLGAWRSNDVVTITAQPVGGTEVLLARGRVDANGVLTATYQPKTTTVYRARYDGDEWYRAAAAERTQ